jgi:hypothetical protein
MFPPEQFEGMRIIQSVWMTEEGEPITVHRTWWERLLTWPWRPWVGSRIVIPQVPRRDVVKMGNDTLMMHPATYQLLKEHLWRE